MWIHQHVCGFVIDTRAPCFVSISTGELKVDRGGLSSSNNAQRLMETLIRFSRSKDPKDAVDAIGGAIFDPSVNSKSGH